MKNVTVLIVLIMLMLSTLSFAGESKISPIYKGQEAPYSGYIINPEFERKVRTINEQNKLLERKNGLLQSLGEVSDTQANLYRKKALKAEIRGDLKGIGGFVLGVFLSSLASYAVIRSLK